MIDWAYSDLFYGSHHKQWVFSDLDNQITLLNDNIVGESITYERCLCENEYYKLGTYSSACIKVKINLSAFGSAQRFKGDRFWVTVDIGDAGGNHTLNVGWFKCYSDTLSSDRKSRELVMYDALYELSSIDVAKWYNDLFLEDGGRDSITLIELRARLLDECLNLDDDHEPLPNDLLEVHKATTYRTLSASFLLKQILAVNGCNCYLTNNNKLHYRTIKQYTWDSENREYIIVPDATLDASKFYSCSYEEYQVLYADKLKIQLDADHAQVYGVRQLNDLPLVNNTLELDYDNIFFRDKAFDDLQPFLYNIWGNVHWRVSFTPAEIELRGNYCYEPGDVIQVTVQDPITGTDKTFYTVIIRQTIQGLQALKMTLSAKGDEYFTAPLSVDSTSYDDYAGGSYDSGDSIRYIPVTLALANWDAISKTQTVSVSGIDADETAQLIQPVPKITSMEDYMSSQILCIGQAQNSLTFSYNVAPSHDIDLFIVVQSVTKSVVTEQEEQGEET